MGVFETIKNAVAGLLTPAKEIIDAVHTSDEEKLTLKAELARVESELVVKISEYETRQMESLHQVMLAEQRSDSWFSKSWRPIVGVGFALQMFLIYALPAIKSAASTVSPPEEYWYAHLAILGVAIVGRSAEKIQRWRNGKNGK